MSRSTDFVRFIPAVALAVLIGVVAGCETAVDPFQESRLFSIGGVIDASADTQFVRLSPLRRTVSISTEPFDALVTTTDLSTGETVGFLGGVTSRLAYWPGFKVPIREECYDLIRRW